MDQSQHQNTGQSHNVRTGNSSPEKVEQFKYFGTTLTNQNSFQEEIKSKLKSGNAYYHLVQNILPASLKSKNLKIKIHRNIILPVVLCGCETWVNYTGGGT
jgi:transcription initiation factor TFIID subunit TAF12